MEYMDLFRNEGGLALMSISKLKFKTALILRAASLHVVC